MGGRVTATLPDQCLLSSSPQPRYQQVPGMCGSAPHPRAPPSSPLGVLMGKQKRNETDQKPHHNMWPHHGWHLRMANLHLSQSQLRETGLVGIIRIRERWPCINAGEELGMRIRQGRQKDSIPASLKLGLWNMLGSWGSGNGVPLASESRDGVPASRCSPESTDTLRSLFTLPLSELKGGTPAWVFFRLELLGEIWLALAPWFPAPTPFEPRLQVGPWFTFWCWDWAPPFPVLP